MHTENSDFVGKLLICLFDADTVLSISPGSVSPGDMLAVRESETVLPQQLAHLPPELPLAPEGTASLSLYTQSISESLYSCALKSSTMAVFFRMKYF